MIVKHSRGISAAAVAKYMFLPGILPWLKRFGAQLAGVFHIFTQIFGATGLIDPSHPCLRVENRRLYSFTEVLLIAWNNLEFNRKNLSQILMFSAVALSALLLIGIIGAGFVQIFLSFGAAQAQYFGTPNTSIPYDVDHDWAFMFLERVFGGQMHTGINFWVQNEAAGVGGSGNVWLSGILVGMLKAYSKALMVIASFMIIYLIVITLVDAARSGQPFGEKFDGIWAPIRFALALGMLVPFSGGGYNGAQLLVFQAAEMGSNLATNIWHRALEDVAECSGDNSRCNFLSTLNVDPGYKFLRDMFLVNLCVYGYNGAIQEGKIKDLNANIGMSVTVTDKEEKYTFGNKEAGSFCGEVTIPNTSFNDKTVPAGFLAGSDPNNPGQQERRMEDYLPVIITQGYNRGAKQFLPLSGQMQTASVAFAADAFCNRDKNFYEVECGSGFCNDEVKKWIESYWMVALGRKDGEQLGDRFFQVYDGQIALYNYWIIDSLKKDARHGWATAGVFYLRMAGAMNAVFTAIEKIPEVTTLPANFHNIYATPSDINPDIEVVGDRCTGWLKGLYKICDGSDAAITLNTLLHKGADWFRNAPKVSDLEFYSQLTPSDYNRALHLSDVDQVESENLQTHISPITTSLLGFFSIGDNNMNPLGTVISWGNMLFNVASIAFALSIAMSVLSWLPGWGAVFGAISGVLQTIGMVLVAPGFVLLFVVPFLPFLYFIFAIVEWVTSIVEAVIGVPLWVLTWITREGDLLAPAMAGIKMLFEIILRPVIIIFSLLAAVITFSASVIFFEDAMKLYMGVYGVQMDEHSWGAATAALMGLGLVLIYVIVIYSLATSCFKLIELIPNTFGRWLDMDEGFGAMVNMSGMMDPFAAAMVATTAVRTAGSINSAIRQGIEPEEYRPRKPKKGDPEKATDPNIVPPINPFDGGDDDGGDGGPPPPSSNFPSIGDGGPYNSSSTIGQSQQHNQSGNNQTPPPPSGRASFVAPSWERFTARSMNRMGNIERETHMQDALGYFGLNKNATQAELNKMYRSKMKDIRMNNQTGDTSLADEEAKKAAAYMELIKFMKGWR